jgi:hypothetical protein
MARLYYTFKRPPQFFAVVFCSLANYSLSLPTKECDIKKRRHGKGDCKSLIQGQRIANPLEQDLAFYGFTGESFGDNLNHWCGDPSWKFRK